jgi:tetraacyldisaccharide 4'-kinase
VLPRGPLRESLGALTRADAIGVVDGPLPEADEREVARRAPDAYRFATARQPSALRPLAGGAALPLEDLRDADVGLLTGVAQPRSVRRTLASLGAHVVAERAFPDHHRYREADLDGLARAAPRWVTTEKDAVKLLPTWGGAARIDVLAIELTVEKPRTFLEWREGKIR